MPDFIPELTAAQVAVLQRAVKLRKRRGYEEIKNDEIITAMRAAGRDGMTREHLSRLLSGRYYADNLGENLDAVEDAIERIVNARPSEITAAAA